MAPYDIAELALTMLQSSRSQFIQQDSETLQEPEEVRQSQHVQWSFTNNACTCE